jgi:dihydroorotate dehydrogenase (fumarate)
MYSLFEEAVVAEDEQLQSFFYHQEQGYAEATSFRPVPGDYHSSLDEYLEQLGRLKNALDIPVIASLNGVSQSGWVRHGRELEQAGADALELNCYYVAADPRETGVEVERRYLDLLAELRRSVRIPITVKISPQFSSVPHMVAMLEEVGAAGVALFNRFYLPSLDLDSLEVRPVPQLSSSADSLLTMRWVAILHGRVHLSLATTGGIHTVQDVLKMLLAGADVTHLCSALLLNGPRHLANLLRDLGAWLDAREYASVAQLKGSVSHQHAKHPAAYLRSSYLETLHGYRLPTGAWD